MENQKVRMFKILFSFLILITLTGCSATTRRLNVFHQNFIKSFREPGEERVSSAKEAFELYECEKDIIYIEGIEVIPETVSSGKEINQRIRFAYCSPEYSEKTPGKIIRTIYYNGAKQFEDVTDYTFRPGIWNVDVFIEIPENTADGTYSFETEIKYNDKVVKGKKGFTVKQ